MSALQQATMATLRLIIALELVAIAYLGGERLLHRSPSLDELLGLLILTFGVERCLSSIVYFSPLRGRFGTIQQESILLRIVDRELSRSLRHDDPLVVVALRAEWRISWQQLSKPLRKGDIDLPAKGRQRVILLTNTTLEQARPVVARLIQSFPVTAVALIDENAMRPVLNKVGFSARYFSTTSRTYVAAQALLQTLELGLFRSSARSHLGDPVRQRAKTGANAARQAPTIYVLNAQDVITANAPASAQSMLDLTERIA